MKSKEKILIFLFAILITIIIFVIIRYYRIEPVYASGEVENDNIKISDAQLIDIEEIIKQNNKIDTEQIITEEINLEYITQYRENNELPQGTMQVIQEGRTGKEQVTKKITFNENGEEQVEELSSIIIKSSANKIVEVGTSKTKKNYRVSENSEIYVTADSTDVREENNEQSRKLTTILRNDKFKVIEMNNNWCKIFVNGQYGWVKLESIASIYANPNYKDNNNEIIPCSFDMELDKPSGLNLEQFQKILTDEKDTDGVFKDNAEYFYYVESQYNINGVFVAAIAIHESGWGKSRIAKNKKNLFGYMAYDSSPYSSASTFDTYAEGIDLVSRVLVKYYLNPKGTIIYNGDIATGTYYNGKTVSAVNKKYASDSGWANKVYSYMEYLYKKI